MNVLFQFFISFFKLENKKGVDLEFLGQNVGKVCIFFCPIVLREKISVQNPNISWL